jgi:hypothetical protein
MLRIANFINPAVCSSGINPADSSWAGGRGSVEGDIDEDGMRMETSM